MKQTHNLVLHVAVLVLVSRLRGARCQVCPVLHVCQGFGYEALNSGTGEAAFCIAAGASPLCPGSDVNGLPFLDIPSTTTSTTPPATSSTPSTPTSSTPSTTSTTTPSTKSTTPSTTSTTTPTTVTPSSTTTTAPPACVKADCVGKTVGMYAHTDCDCQKYFVCKERVAGVGGLILYRYRCTGLTVFDPDTYNCVTDASVCPYTSTTTPSTTSTTPSTTSTTTPTTITPSSTTTTAPPACVKADCVDKTVGVYAHTDCDCQKYFVCKERVAGVGGLILYRYQCTGLTVFDPDTYNCVTDASVCPYTR